MSRRKKTPLNYWQTASPYGDEKYFVRLGATLLQSEAFLKLSNKAKIAYIYMIAAAKDGAEFIFPAREHARIMARATFAAAKRELIEAGFITEKENGYTERKETIYRFSLNWRR